MTPSTPSTPTTSAEWHTHLDALRQEQATADAEWTADVRSYFAPLVADWWTAFYGLRPVALIAATLVLLFARLGFAFTVWTATWTLDVANAGLLEAMRRLARRHAARWTRRLAVTAARARLATAQLRARWTRATRPPEPHQPATMLRRLSQNCIAANQYSAREWFGVRGATLGLRLAGRRGFNPGRALGHIVARVLGAWWAIVPPRLHPDWLWQLGTFSGYALRREAMRLRRDAEIGALLYGPDANPSTPTPSLFRPMKATEGGSYLEQWFSTTDSRPTKVE